MWRIQAANGNYEVSNERMSLHRRAAQGNSTMQPSQETEICQPKRLTGLCNC